MPLQSPSDKNDYSESGRVLHTNLEIIFEDLERLVREPVDPDAHLAPVPQHEIDEILAGLMLPEEIAASNEVTGDAVSNEVTKSSRKAKKPVSNQVTAPKRGTDSRDKQIIEEIRKIGIVCDEAGEPASVANFPPLFSTTNFEHTGHRATLTFANEALELLACDESGTRPVSWSLNLSRKRQDEAQRHPKGFAACMGGLINRRLEKLLGFVPPLWFGVHADRGRLHLHGGILIAPEREILVAAALKHAGGKMADPESDLHQLHMNPDQCDDGWVTYAMRERGKARKLIGERYLFVGKKLRVEARRLYDRYRSIVRATNISASL